MSSLRGTASSAAAEPNAASIQSAFRDVTNYYLNANKENIPPGGAAVGGFGGKGKGNIGCDADRACCGTPVETVLQVENPLEKLHQHKLDSAEDDYGEAAFENALTAPPATIQAPTTITTTPAVAASPTAVAPKTHNPYSNTSATSCDSSLPGVASVPGHNGSSQPPSANTSGLNASSTNTATKLMQQRNRSLNAAHTALLSSPLYTQSKPGNTVPTTVDVATYSTAAAAAVPASSPQSSLHCTPSGARRSAAAAARALSETPTRIEDISFYLNNSFESGSETPTHDGAVAAAAARTPTRAFDLQQAVEEMLRGCLDSSTPAKRSDASGMSPQGSRKRQLQQLEAVSATATAAAGMAPHNAPFSTYATLDSFFAAPAPAKSISTTTMNSASNNLWVQGFSMTADRTPEHFEPPQGIFAESDEDDGDTPPLSNNASHMVPAAGVRRDPPVYFSTAAVSVATAYREPLSGAPQDPHTRRPTAEEEAMLLSANGDDVFASLPLSGNMSTTQHPNTIEFHNDGTMNGPDMLAMLAAAVQQQQQHSPRSAGAGSAATESQTFSDREADVAALLPPSPPSYEDGHPLNRYSRRDGATPAGTATAANAATAHAPPPPTRRSHHLPQVKAAAGSLIAVSGRRVPVNKLHLLSLSSGEESVAALSSPAAAADGLRNLPRGGGATRFNNQSPPGQQQQQQHVEGPSMRRVPKAKVVTVTHAPPVAAPGRSSCGSCAGGVQQPVSSASASFPSFSSHINFADAAVRTTSNIATTTTTTHFFVGGPSARRFPLTAHSGSSLHLRQNSAAANLEVGGVRFSNEADVVAVLQFSKGQTMRFLTNLSPAAIKEAQVALSRDLEGSNSNKNTCKSDCMAAALASLTHAPLSSVELGKSYLAHIYGDQSPYENVPFEDVGFCVRLYTSAGATAAEEARREHISGVLLRKVDVFACDGDRQQHERALQQQTAAYIECERQFKFSSLPFQLESIYFTFDGSVCVVFYRVVATDTSAPATAHRFLNTSRVVRELQFHLNCRVFLKQC